MLTTRTGEPLYFARDGVEIFANANIPCHFINCVQLLFNARLVATLTPSQVAAQLCGKVCQQSFFMSHLAAPKMERCLDGVRIVFFIVNIPVCCHRHWWSVHVCNMVNTHTKNTMARLYAYNIYKIHICGLHMATLHFRR